MSGNEITVKVLEMEKQKLENELKDKKLIQQMEDDVMNKPHSVFKEMTNGEVINMLGESAYEIPTGDMTVVERKDLSDDEVKALALKLFRVEL